MWTGSSALKSCGMKSCPRADELQSFMMTIVVEWGLRGEVGWGLRLLTCFLTFAP